MKQSPKSFQNNTVFFFNTSNSLKKRGQLKGSKLRSKDEDKLLTLKTKYIQRTEVMKARYSLNELQKPATQRQRASVDNWRYRSIYKRFQPEKRQINEQSDIIITAQSNSLPKRMRSRDLPEFSSANLEGKMNEYLNLIIRKSHDSHHQKIKKIFEGQKQKKNQKFQNMFYRRMKLNQNRRKQQRDKEQYFVDLQHRINGTDQILNNLDRLTKRARNSIDKQK